jgi:hypothetical protein
VAVHGICEHPSGYSDKWWAALRNHLPRPLEQTLGQNRDEVLRSHHVTPLDPYAARDLHFAEREQSEAEALRDILQERAAQQARATLPEQDPHAAPRRSSQVAGRALFGIPGLDCIDDFAKYLLNRSIRDAVQNEFIDAVAPLLRAGDGVGSHQPQLGNRGGL